MSEEFETGLNELYTRAAAAHAGGAGFPTTALVATARRNRRVRAAAVSMATVAAVVGVGFGGAAALRTFGDGVPVSPAGSETPIATPTVIIATSLECGDPLDETVVFDDRVSVEIDLLSDDAVVGGALSAQLTVAATDPPTDSVDQESLLGVTYVAVRDGVVVGVGDDTVDSGALTELSGRYGATAPTAINLAECGGAASLGAGRYELYAQAVLAVDAGQGEPFIAGGGPWPFTVTADADPDPLPATPDVETDAPQPPEELGVDGASAAFTEGEPLADGDYFGLLQGIDAANGTIDVDLARFFGGQAAEDYIAANVPDAEPLDDYYIANDLETVTTLPVAADAPVWDWCFEPTEQSPFGYYLRTLDQWAVAPVYSGEDVPAYQCADGANVLRGDLYWLRVRDGVVIEVTGQYVP
jgi:hypothetical protein